MKKIITLIMTTFLSQAIIAQVSGNINYQNQVRFPDQNININFPSSNDLYLSVKGLANVKADSYVAIFSVTQVGKTTSEVNGLIDERLSKAETEIKLKKGTEVYIDMISFVPVYEYEIEKKLFSKKSYNEVPKGFELKKNIHIKYSNPIQLNDFIRILSNQEIYDLVRVDYFSSALENVKKELMNKAKLALQEKVKNYESILGATFESNDKRIMDGFKMVLPVEMYKSYASYNSSSLNLKRSTNVNNANKGTTLYYQPIIDKEFDFIINPTILEPVIQVMYEIKLVINRDKKENTTTKEYVLITPNGDMKNIQMNN
ncbi:SIMPL domain-containing protein [Crocinitomix catalasitica]|uniref:SIMPL domain-containing protein n=1 Tax=Crocinitomix catalasitica TaxID=184607 RepID=UPI000A74F11A|nr:SIMPL domain-containing protein [Crocinitomix catalasitica]